MKLLFESRSVELDPSATPPITIQCSFTCDGIIWSEFVDVIVDTGSAGTFLCGKTMGDLGLHLKVSGISGTQYANGQQQNELVGVIAGMAFRTIPSNQQCTFLNVPVTVSANATANLIGQDIFRWLNISIVGGQLTFLAPRKRLS